MYVKCFRLGLIWNLVSLCSASSYRSPLYELFRSELMTSKRVGINKDNILVNIQGTPVHVHLSSVKSEWSGLKRRENMKCWFT